MADTLLLTSIASRRVQVARAIGCGASTYKPTCLKLSEAGILGVSACRNAGVPGLLLPGYTGYRTNHKVLEHTLWLFVFFCFFVLYQSSTPVYTPALSTPTIGAILLPDRVSFPHRSAGQKAPYRRIQLFTNSFLQIPLLAIMLLHKKGHLRLPQYLYWLRQEWGS